MLFRVHDATGDREYEYTHGDRPRLVPSAVVAVQESVLPHFLPAGVSRRGHDELLGFGSVDLPGRTTVCRTVSERRWVSASKFSLLQECKFHGFIEAAPMLIPTMMGTLANSLEPYSAKDIGGNPGSVDQVG